MFSSDAIFVTMLNIFVTLMSLVLINVRASAVVISDLYDLGIFQNRDLSKQLFKHEIKFVNQLRKVHNSLKTWIPEVSHVKNLMNLRSELLYLKNFSLRFPDQDDFEKGVRGILLLHETFNLDLDGLTVGNLSYFGSGNDVINVDFNPGSKMDFNDFYIVAKMADTLKLYDRALDFIKVSIKFAPDDHKVRNTLETMLNNLIKANNDILFRKRSFLTSNLKIKPYFLNQDGSKKSKQPKWIWNLLKTPRENLGPEFIQEAVHHQVCRGDFTRGVKKNPKSPDSFKKCGFVHHHDPFLKMGPFKMERIKRWPFIVIFRDFFSKRDLKWIKDHSRPRMTLEREFEGGDEEKKFYHKKKYISVQKTRMCWIQNRQEIQGISKRIEMATRMNITGPMGATSYQIGNYGPGGSLKNHLDNFGLHDGIPIPPYKENLYENGDVIATFMGWLSNVDVGGHTAFIWPGHNHLLEADEASAAFWFNVHANGRRDVTTTHAGCPTLKGSKWTLNKWIYMYDQWKSYPCQVRIHEKIPPLKFDL